MLKDHCIINIYLRSMDLLCSNIIKNTRTIPTKNYECERNSVCYIFTAKRLYRFVGLAYYNHNITLGYSGRRY